jgi:hypothetical protein
MATVDTMDMSDIKEQVTSMETDNTSKDDNNNDPAPETNEVNINKVEDLEKDLPLCNGCAKTQPKLLQCGKCGVTKYCSKECQIKHWNESHKYNCQAIRLVLTPKDAPFSVSLLLGDNGKGCYANRDLKAGEIILSEGPLAMVTTYSKDTILKLTQDQIGCLFGENPEISKRYFTYDHDEFVLFEKEKDPKKKVSVPLYLVGKLTEAILIKEPWFAKSTFFQTKLTGSQIEIDVINDLYDHRVEVEKDAEKHPSKKEVSFTFGSMHLNAIAIRPLLTQTQVGLGFFPNFSMFNHSCNGNIDYAYAYGKIHVFTTRDVKKGEFLEYDYLDGKSCVTNRDLRRKLIGAVHAFECKCQYCKASQDIVLDEWTFKSMENEELSKQISGKLFDLFNQQKYAEYIDLCNEIWNAHSDEIVKYPCSFLHIASQVAVAQASCATTNVETSTDILLRAMTLLTEDSNFINLPDGTPRNTFALKQLFHGAHFFLYIKRMLITCMNNEENGKEKIRQFISKIGKESLEKLVNFDVLWFQNRHPLKLSIFSLDEACNKMMGSFLDVLRMIRDELGN